MRNRNLVSLAPVLLAAALAACGDGGVDSDEEARRAYLGLDRSIEKSLNLGMAGFNAADNANIPEQSSTGDVEGTIRVSGQVDAGASANKEMRLDVALVAYSDGPALDDDDAVLDVLYSTDPDDLPYLSLSLRGIPDGDFAGTLTGTYGMTGELEGAVTLDLELAGELEDAGDGQLARVEGTTEVTGTARASDGVFQVVVTL